MSRVTYQQTRA